MGTKTVKVTAVAAISMISLAGCLGQGSGDDVSPSTTPATGTPQATESMDSGESSASPSSEAPASPSSDTESSAAASGGGEDCYVELFDSDNFDETDDHIKVTEAGKYEDLTSLPGATEDWTDEADSIRVGGGATVTIWPEKNYSGQSQTLKAGSENASIDGAASLELTCE